MEYEIEQRIRELEQRLAAVEASLARLQHSTAPTNGTRLIAPVEIVDADGTLIAEIHKIRHDAGIRVYNTEGHVAAALGADGTNCGYLAIRDAAGTLVGYLDVEMSGARLTLEDHEQNGGVVIFGGDSGDNNGGGINISNSSGDLVAAIWATSNGAELRFYDGKDEQPIQILPALDEG